MGIGQRVEELEAWVKTSKRCIKSYERTVRMHQERHEALNERLEQLSKRQDVLDSRLSLHMRVMEHANRPRHLVPCPVCDGECCEHYRGDGTADDPPDYRTCLFCEGSGEVAECQAIHVRVLQTKIRRLESELGTMRHQRDHWRKAITQDDPLKRFPPEPMPVVGQRDEKWQTREEGE